MTERIQEVSYTNLSKQAVGALMMALQKSLLEQSDIVPVLENFKIVDSFGLISIIYYLFILYKQKLKSLSFYIYHL